eukprot:TRINITY_DN2014_c4_g1_i1.p1 TRINITY_DN2014_c4_g1~~TRINITY_DN2014_c4_g1_i1.p1  ORF type:complete len:180 (+),score=51.63 TRINITY_DN2014_c4_g1_i1:98-637(+)
MKLLKNISSFLCLLFIINSLILSIKTDNDCDIAGTWYTSFTNSQITQLLTFDFDLDLKFSTLEDTAREPGCTCTRNLNGTLSYSDNNLQVNYVNCSGTSCCVCQPVLINSVTKFSDDCLSVNITVESVELTLERGGTNFLVLLSLIIVIAVILIVIVIGYVYFYCKKPSGYEVISSEDL